jgi:hypothetical protein
MSVLRHLGWGKSLRYAMGIRAGKQGEIEAAKMKRHEEVVRA